VRLAGDEVRFAAGELDTIGKIVGDGGHAPFVPPDPKKESRSDRVGKRVGSSGWLIAGCWRMLWVLGRGHLAWCSIRANALHDSARRTSTSNSFTAYNIVSMSRVA